MSEAPNDDEGLKGFKPLKPVVCGFSPGVYDIDGADEVAVAPVGCEDSEDHTESENADDVEVFCELSEGAAADWLFEPVGLLNEDAMLEISVAPGFNAQLENAKPFVDCELSIALFC